MASVGELLEGVAEFGQGSTPGVARPHASDLVGGRGPAGRIALEAVLKCVWREEAVEREPVAPDSRHVIG